MKQTCALMLLVTLILAGDLLGDAGAWIDYGLTGENKPATALATAEDFRLHLMKVEPEDAEAMLWALAQRGEIEAQTLLDISLLARIPDQTRAAAVLAMTEMPETAYPQLLALIATGTWEDEGVERLMTWRAILALPKPAMKQPTITPDKMVLAGWCQEPDLQRPEQWPIFLAAVSQTSEALASRHPPGHALGDLTRLATIEAADNWGYRFMDPQRPVLERVLTTRIDVNFRVDDMKDALASDEPGVGELALLTVQERMELAERATLAGELLLNPATMRAGLLLGTLNAWGGGTLPVPADLPEHLDGYRQLLRASNQAPVLPTVAMQFARHDPEAAPACLLVLLERGYLAEALDLLFPNEGEPVINVRDWLVDQRGWHILEKHLPNDAPRFWLYGDPEAQAFQLRVIDAWVRIERERGGLAKFGELR
ncbi:MAG: hypothetical protein RIG82_10255 [Phycisphaeraceae bacterium]